MPPKQQPTSFKLDQEVLCAHGANHYYSARIIEITQSSSGENTYRVHYKGWNVRYDEDILESETKKRFLEHTPANVEMAAKAIKEARMKAKARKRSTIETAVKKRLTGGSESRQSTPADLSRAHSAESDGSTPSAKLGKQRAKATKAAPGTAAKSQSRPVVKPKTATTSKEKDKDTPAKGQQQNTPRPRSSAPTRKRKVTSDVHDDSDTASEELGVTHTARRDVKDREGESPDAELGSRPGIEDEALDVVRDARDKEVGDGRKLKFDLPQELKMFLLDGEDISKRLMMLSVLPARVCVDDILLKYLEETKSPLPKSEYPKFFDNTMREICVNGLRECFNVVLGRILLYKFERPQYSDIHDQERKRHQERLLKAGVKLEDATSSTDDSDNRKSRRNKQNSDPNSDQFVPNMSKHYGFMHLLRMLVAFEKVITHLGWPNNSLDHIDAFLEDFSKFLVAKKDELCNIEEDFAESTTEYQRRVWNAAE